MNQAFDVVELATTYANKSAQDILKLAFSQFGDDLWISFSGAEDVVLVDMAWKLNKNVKVFSLDTGRLHEESRAEADQLRAAAELRAIGSIRKTTTAEATSTPRIIPPKANPSTISQSGTGETRISSIFF